MPEFAQFQEEHPVLPETPVASKAKGQNAMAQAFGQVAQQAAQASINLAKEHSKAMFMNAATQSSDIMNQAQVDMIKNPGQADAIQKSAEASLMKTSQVPMSKGDRARYDYISHQKQNSLKVQAARTDAHLSSLTNKAKFLGSMRQLQSDYFQSMKKGDQKGAKYLYESILDNAQNAVKGGLITPDGFYNAIKTVDLQHQQLEKLHSDALTGKSTAAQSNALSMDAMNPSDDINAASLSANAGTEALKNHHDDLMDRSAIDKAIYSGNISDSIEGKIALSSPKEFEAYRVKMAGAQEARGLIASNPSTFHIQTELNNLNAKEDLSGVEQSKFHVLKNYMSGLKHNFWQSLGGTKLGAQAIHERQNLKASSNLMPVVDKQQAIQEADHRFVDNGISIGESQDMPLDHRNPIPLESISKGEASFNLGADPNHLINEIQYWKPEQRFYYAKQMGDANHSSIAYAVAHGLDNKMSPSYMKDLISANQKGVSFSPLNVKPDGDPRIGDNIIRNKLVDSLTDITGYIVNQPNGPQRVKALLDTNVNYVKGFAIKTNDLKLSNVDDIVSNVKTQLSHAYDLRISDESIYNKSQISLPDKDYDILSSASIYHAKEDLKNEHPGWSEARLTRSVEDLQLKTFVTAQNKVLVTDMDGAVHYSAVYSDSLLNSAKHFHHQERARREAVMREAHRLYDPMIRSGIGI